MPVLRRPLPLLAIAAAVGFGVAACSGSAEGPSTGLRAVEATTTSVADTAPSTDGTVTSAPGSSSSASTASMSETSISGSATTDETSTTPSTAATPSTSPTVTSSAPQSSATTIGSGAIPIRLRLDRRVDDVPTEGFASLVEQVLTDARGWSSAGFAFSFDDTDFDYTVVLAEGSEVDRLCLPYDTFGRFSCQIGPTVALNADRWRSAVDSWPASLDAYRTMLVNHEVGHLIGQHHPATRCPGEGQPAPVMAQQSSGVAPCLANPWPLPWEITCAASGLEPLAPPYERNISLTCGPDGPIG